MLEALQGRRRAEREQERQERAATAGEARGRLARALAAVEQDLARLSPPASTAPEPDLAPEPAQTPELDLPPTGPSLSRELAPGIWIVGTPPASAEDRRERRAAELQRRRDAAEGRREQREAEMQRRREQRAADLEERRRQLNAALEAVGTAPVVSGPVTAPDDTARAIAELALELQRPKPVLVRVLDEPRLVAAAGNPYPKPLGAALLAGALGGAMVALFVEYCARESARRKVV